ncbi:unnamed protein product [Ixodes pacificus]
MKVVAVSLAFLLIAGLISTSLAENDEGGEKELVRVRRSGHFRPLRHDAGNRHSERSAPKGCRCYGKGKRICICDWM